MAQTVCVTYLENSGFAVYNEHTALIFDYIRSTPVSQPDTQTDAADRPLAEGPRFPGGYVTNDALKAFERVFVFVSHSHGDHYDRAIFKWLGHKGVDYVLGYDIMDAPTGYRLTPGEVRVFPELTVTARASTDLGVSFMIDWHETGLGVFHAGDLNLWHWRDESTLREIEQAETAFYAAMEPIYGARVDLAFFPVDPRQGAMYDAGAVHFISRVQPKLFFPMHFQDRADVAMDFARRNTERRTQVVPLTKPGETKEVTI
ncbi:hydrolase [Clostridia bacterium]|nr:hydrolase [Clostridia bacterium]